MGAASLERFRFRCSRANKDTGNVVPIVNNRNSFSLEYAANGIDIVGYRDAPPFFKISDRAERDARSLGKFLLRQVQPSARSATMCGCKHAHIGQLFSGNVNVFVVIA